ncbi:MAG TPA: hypothetical protein VEI74_07660 [Candidatus Methylomirabilis sp.]|nr:hypothetical protein [Candidatus Methylomirabilis sp.]
MNVQKSALTAAVMGVLALGVGSAQAAQIAYATFTGAGAVSNFTWLNIQGTGCTANCASQNPVYGGPGNTIGGTNDVSFTWTGTVFTSSSDYTGPGGAQNASLSSPNLLLGIPWTAHDVQIFAPGSYSFDTALGGGVAESGSLTMTVGTHQLGIHMLMDWNGNFNIDMVNVWNLNSTFSNCGVSYYDTTTSNCLWAGSTNPAGNNVNTVFTLASTDNDGDGTLGVPMVSGGPFYGHNFNFNLQGTLTTVPVPAAVWLFSSGLMGLFGFAKTCDRLK